MIDIKVEQVGQPVATTEPVDGAKRTPQSERKKTFDVEQIRARVRTRLAAEFPRVLKGPRGRQRLAEIVEGLLEDAQVLSAASLEHEHQKLLADVEREARHRCGKCHFPMAPYDNTCRVCEVRALRERDHNIEFLLRSAMRTLSVASRDVIKPNVKDDMSLQLTSDQTEQLSDMFWRVHSLVAAAVEEPMPAGSTVAPDLWAGLGTLPLTALMTSTVMNMLINKGWMSSPSTEKK